MKKLTSIILILFLSLLSSPSWSENLVCKYTGFNCPPEILEAALIKVGGIYYKKFTDIPFTGKIIGGKRQGSMKDGKFDGLWKIYNEKGQLKTKINYKDGKPHGLFEKYYIDRGTLMEKGNFKNGVQDGEWIYYNINGSILFKRQY